MQQIAKSVEALTGISIEQMRSKRGPDEVHHARMLLVARMYNAGFSYAIIDKFLGRKHPGSNWIHRRYLDICSVDRAFASRYSAQGEKVYVAGAVTGLSALEVNAKFEAAARLLAAEGYTAVLPTHIVPDGTAWREAMRICIGELTRCRYIFPLPCATESKGATIELQIAKIIGMPILNIARGDLKHWLNEEEEAA